MCSYHSIRQDLLEGFDLNSIREILLSPSMIKKIEEELKKLLNNEHSDIKDGRIAELEGQIKDIDAKIANLISLAENGMGSASIAERIQQLEEARRLLQEQLINLQQPGAAKRGRY